VAIVGYTNAGKSTLLNRLTGAGVRAENRLFATLDPTTRRLQLPSGRTVLVTDTVGFIQKLPTDLVAAFRATLEEVTYADLVLHVVDGAAASALEQATAVDELRQVGGLEETEYTQAGTLARGRAPRGALHRFREYRLGAGRPSTSSG